MKRWISLLLCLTMTGSLLPFAVAEEDSADARLRRVTEQVKTTLDLDTDRFTDFRGDLSQQELGDVWSLNWTGEQENLSIEALDDGTVVSYWASDDQDVGYSYNRQGLPAFPQTDSAQARQAAEAFLDKVLDKDTERVILQEPEDKQLRSTSVRFYGDILLNGLPSPLTYSVTVRGSDYTVTNFRRDAPSRTFLGNIPGAVPSVTKEDAAGKLKDTETLELLYVLDETAGSQTTGSQGTNGKPVLRYVPKTEGSWAVDAQTGEVKDITGGGAGLYRNAPLAAGTEEAAMDAGGAAMKSLNAVEQAGVEKLEGVLNQDALDRILRAESAFQLSDAYTVQSANYRLVKEDDGQGGERERVICTLHYTAGENGEQPPVIYREEPAADAGTEASGTDTAGTDTAGTAGTVATAAPAAYAETVRTAAPAAYAETVRTAAPAVSHAELFDHTFTVDARTGVVEMLYTSETWNRDRTPSVSAAQARETASAFLFRFAAATPVDASRLELRDTADKTADGAASYAFTFARIENGVFFPADAVTIRVDCGTGAVSGLNYNWHEGLAQRDFPSPAGVASPEDALSAWAGTYDAVLAYRLLPRDLNPASPVEAKLISVGMTRFYDLFLSYALERPANSEYSQYDNCPGIDAKTGQPVIQPGTAAEKLAYSDISGNRAEADILKLAEYGIGYAGGAFQPDRAVTQWDLVCLLSSVQGYRINPDQASDAEKDSAYQTVIYMGALRRGERDDSAALTRGGAVKLLLNAAGYRNTAELRGIWRTDYTDAWNIPAGELGYAALAQALGMVSGTYGSGTAIKRADAAALLCRLMEREG